MVHLPLVTPEKWAEIACMGSFAFGVNTSCNDCDYKMNGCLRQHMIDGLKINELATERLIGYDLSARYHYQDFDWDGKTRVQIDNAGIAELNVQQKITLVEEDVAISPYILENVSVADHIVTIPRSIADNPSHLMFRGTINIGAIDQLYEDGYPRISGSNWKIKLDTNDEVVNVQHCKYMIVTIPSPDCGGDIFAVYANTEEIIPFAKPPVYDEEIGETTYWFYAWSMVDPAFQYDETIDLEAAEFYKLVQEIDFICSTSVEALPQVMCQRSGCDDDLEYVEDEHISLTILNDNIIDVHRQNSSDCGCSYPMKLRIFYKTDPYLVRDNFDAIIKAIVWLTAAELPIRTCDCEAPTYGFIWSAQASYGQLRINQITGAEQWQLAYGHMHGQMVYAEQMHKVKKERRVVIA